LITEIALGDAIEFALDALLADRLALLAGAGLSIAPPSSLPSAAKIAKAAKEKYDGTYGASRAPLPTLVGDQAQFFFERDELATVYFRTLIDQHAFASPPNPGHFAVADFLLIRAFQTAITTNVDALIEAAGQDLFGQVGVGVEVAKVAVLPPTVVPLLKIHGCRVIDEANMIWAQGQLSREPVSSRIADNAQWLNVRLLDKDLLVVGYWSDWDYLNAVLSLTLGAIRPSRVIIVDPCSHDQFASKAPELFAIGERASADFVHLIASGSDFLDRLRREFSKTFIRQVLYLGANAYQHATQAVPQATWLEPQECDAQTYWRIRRDLEGCARNKPSLMRDPPPEPLLGASLIEIQALGGIADGQYWLVRGVRVRIVRAANQLLHEAQAAFAGDTPPSTAPDMTIAVGAEFLALPYNIARIGTNTTIVRSEPGQWFTRTDGLNNLRA
jgi:hypothetical protein